MQLPILPGTGSAGTRAQLSTELACAADDAAATDDCPWVIAEEEFSGPEEEVGVDDAPSWLSACP